MTKLVAPVGAVPTRFRHCPGGKSACSQSAPAAVAGQGVRHVVTPVIGRKKEQPPVERNDDEIEALKRQLAELSAKLEALTKGKAKQE